MTKKPATLDDLLDAVIEDEARAARIICAAPELPGRKSRATSWAQVGWVSCAQV